ncbi:hypothetical protein IPA_05365 [Ignicoccus pacificus DSM 13166]|uniref:Glycosyl transferase family 1 domain-containing protein n=1 Tax=Ignicoccus pacificus DSM 13166 TaxID=940294 RepID=A0A977KBB1_9CREN|nr:hypothetical protein IPA_05365 [Ignicoccus pacificus DSM 13166]
MEIEALKVCVVHEYFDELGGAELVAISMLKVIKELGHEAMLFSASEVNAIEIKRKYGFSLDDIIVRSNLKTRYLTFSEKVLGLVGLGKAARMRRLLAVNHLILEAMRNGCNVIIETHSNVPTRADISYIHYPATRSVSESTNTVDKVYNTIVKVIAKMVSKRSAFVLANSTWTANKIYEDFSIIPLVLYPPARVEEFLELSNKKKENIIITVSRFSPEKRLEEVIRIAKDLKEFTFYIVGSASEDSKYLRKLRNLKESMEVNNLELKPNLSFDELKELIGRAKYYLHPPLVEHFGIAIVEAMAAGAIPFVLKDGGAWFDIVAPISRELGYSDIHEVIDKVRFLERDHERYSKLKESCVTHSKKFSFDAFKSSFSKTLNHIMRVKFLKSIMQVENS